MNSAHLQKNKCGLAVGVAMAALHTGWAAMVFMHWAEPVLRWILSLHFLSFVFEMQPFELGRAVGLIVFTFVYGYIVGWVFAALWNAFHSSKADISG